MSSFSGSLHVSNWRIAESAETELSSNFIALTKCKSLMNVRCLFDGPSELSVPSFRCRPCCGWAGQPIMNWHSTFGVIDKKAKSGSQGWSKPDDKGQIQCELGARGETNKARRSIELCKNQTPSLPCSNVEQDTRFRCAWSIATAGPSETP